MGTAIKRPVPDGVKPSFVIFVMRALWRSEQSISARMSKITNDYLTYLTWSGMGCFIAVPIWQQWPSKGFNPLVIIVNSAVCLHSNNMWKLWQAEIITKAVDYEQQNCVHEGLTNTEGRTQ